MEQVHEYYAGSDYRTQVLITEQGEKEMEKYVHVELAERLENQAERGFQGYKGSRLRDEGRGVWAFGPNTWTVRIAGFFLDDVTRDIFVIGGVWKGKSGGGKKGRGRPPWGDTVVDRVAILKQQGVVYVPRSSLSPREGERAEDRNESPVLRHGPSNGRGGFDRSWN